MNWIAYVFQHFYIIFIILAVASAFLKRTRSVPQGQQGNQMPPFNGNQPNQERKQAKHAENRVRQTLSEQKDKLASRSERPVSLEISPAMSVTSLNSSDGGVGPTTATGQITGSLDMFNETNIIQGIVWSEIVSKPRAKRPYRR
jgi:hypothetical protein